MQKLLLSLSMLPLLAACQSQTPTVSVATSVSDFCLIASPILWSSKDTPETIVQIKKLNASGVAVCHWKTN